VLVVEDDQTLRALTVAVLESAGYRVFESPNAEAAIRTVEKYTNSIDVVLTDVVMPGMSGRKLSQHLLALRPDMKILLMSGYAQELIERYGALEPGVSLIEKPFTRQSLLEAVSAILGKSKPN
jgi:DNA-binding response OmpR family regulator